MSPKGYTEALMSSTSDCGLLWKQGVGEVIRRDHARSERALIPTRLLPLREDSCAKAHPSEGHDSDRAETGVTAASQGMPRFDGQEPRKEGFHLESQREYGPVESSISDVQPPELRESISGVF